MSANVSEEDKQHFSVILEIVITSWLSPRGSEEIPMYQWIILSELLS